MSSRRRFLWSVGTTLLALVGLLRMTAAGTAEQAVTAAEHQWFKAQRTNNADLLGPLLADGVIVTTGDGEVLAGKDAVLADAKAVTWSSVEATDLKVTVFDQTAIATGTWIGKGADSAGKPLNVRVRFTDTWVRMANGAWLCVAGHDSPTKM